MPFLSDVSTLAAQVILRSALQSTVTSKSGGLPVGGDLMCKQSLFGDPQPLPNVCCYITRLSKRTKTERARAFALPTEGRYEEGSVQRHSL